MHSKPKFRTGLTLRAEQLNEAIAKAAFADNGLWQSCISCDHWQSVNEMCGLYKSRPPARVIAFGCPSYADDNDIPF